MEEPDGIGIVVAHAELQFAEDSNPVGIRGLKPLVSVWIAADSQRNKSQLHKLSFVWPRNVSQDGPADSGR